MNNEHALSSHAYQQINDGFTTLTTHLNGIFRAVIVELSERGFHIFTRLACI